MRWALFGVAMLVAIGVVMLFASTEPPPRRYLRVDYPVPDPAQRLFGHLPYTEEQSAAITEAGFAIQKGHSPAATLSPDSLAQLREVHAMIQQVECAADDHLCPQARVKVLECLEEAANLIHLRLRKIEEIPWPLYTAAMGVSVVTREIYYRSVAALVHFCLKLTEAREKYRPLRPGTLPAR